MSLYTITEPHPTVPQNSYTHSGRGGAGNFFRAPATTSPSGVPTPADLTTAATRTRTSSSTTTTTSSSSTARRFYSGRGGAGNAHSTSSERPVLLFDEEFTRAEVRDKRAMVGYAGRGGAGNIFSSGAGSVKKSGSESGDDGETLARRDSSSTEGSARSGMSVSGLWARVRSAGQ
jgi:hypothetical protein